MSKIKARNIELEPNHFIDNDDVLKVKVRSENLRHAANGLEFAVDLPASPELLQMDATGALSTIAVPAGAADFATANLTADGARSHDWDGNTLAIVNSLAISMAASSTIILDTPDLTVNPSGSTEDGKIYLTSRTGNSVGISSSPTSATYTLVMPAAAPGEGDVLSFTATGVGSFIAGGNIANADLASTGNRVHDFSGHSLSIVSAVGINLQASTITMDTNAMILDPTGGNPILGLVASGGGVASWTVDGAQTASYTLTMPQAAPTVNGQTMVFTTGGVGSFVTPSGGSGFTFDSPGAATTAGLAGATAGDLVSAHGNAGGAFRYYDTGWSGLPADAQAGMNFQVESTQAYLARQGIEPVNALWFGADPTGATDSYAALQACLDYVVSTNTDGSGDNVSGTRAMYIPGGQYLMSNGLSTGVPPANGQSSVLIFGDGWYSTMLKAASGASFSSFIDFPASGGVFPTDGNRFFTIRDLGFDGYLNSKTHDGINAMKSSYFSIERCSFNKCRHGVKGRNWSNTLFNNRFTECLSGFFFSAEAGIGDVTNVTINDNNFLWNKFSACEYGVRGAPGLDINSINIAYNQFDAVTRAGVLLNGNVNSLNIQGCYFEANNAGGANTAQLYQKPGDISPVTVVGCPIVLHPVQGVATTAVNGQFTGTIQNNKFVSNTGRCISMSSANGMKIVGNQVFGGIVLDSFVEIEHPIAFDLGPQIYTIAQENLIDQQMAKNNGTRLMNRVVKLYDQDSGGSGNADLIDKSAGFQIISRRPFAAADYPGTPWAILDLLGNGFTLDTASTLPTKAYSPDGTVCFEWTVNTMSVTTTLVKHRRSGLNGGYLKVFGDMYSENGTGRFRVQVTDGALPTREFTIQNQSAGSVAGRGATMQLTEVTGATEETVVIRCFDPGSTGDFMRLSNFAICSASYSPHDYPTLRTV